MKSKKESLWRGDQSYNTTSGKISMKHKISISALYDICGTSTSLWVAAKKITMQGQNFPWTFLQCCKYQKSKKIWNVQIVENFHFYDAAEDYNHLL